MVFGESQHHASLRRGNTEMTEAVEDCPVPSNSDLAFSSFLIIHLPANTFLPQAQTHLWKASKNSSKANLISLAFGVVCLFINHINRTMLGKKLFPMLMYLSNLFYLAGLSTAHFILFYSFPKFYLASFSLLSVTIIILLIAPST